MIASYLLSPSHVLSQINWLDMSDGVLSPFGLPSLRSLSCVKSFSFRRRRKVLGDCFPWPQCNCDGVGANSLSSHHKWMFCRLAVTGRNGHHEEDFWGQCGGKSKTDPEQQRSGTAGCSDAKVGAVSAQHSGQSSLAATVISSLGNFCGINLGIVLCFHDANLVIYFSIKSVSYSTSFYWLAKNLFEFFCTTYFQYPIQYRYS